MKKHDTIAEQVRQIEADEDVFLRTPHNYDRNAASNFHGTSNLDENGKPMPSLTQQQFADECDINKMVERFGITGEMPQLTEMPSFQEFHGIFDYQTAMNTIRHAEETFMSLPATLRARFDNNPQNFYAFCDNQENYDEAARLGILDPANVEKRRAAAQAEADAKFNAAVNAAAAARADGTTPPPADPQKPVKKPARGD